MTERSTSRRHLDTPSELPAVLEFMQALWATAHALERTSKRMKSRLGVTGPQRLVLRIVGLRPGGSAGDIAATLHVHPSTLTGVLRRLKLQGLISRTVDPSDRRRAVLTLTAAGRRLNARESETIEEAVSRALTTISRRDQQATRRVLAQLNRALEPRDAAKRRVVG